MEIVLITACRRREFIQKGFEKYLPVFVYRIYENTVVGSVCVNFSEEKIEENCVFSFVLILNS